MIKILKISFKLIKVFSIIILFLLVIIGFAKYTIKCLDLGNSNKALSLVNNSYNKSLLMEEYETNMKITYISNGLKTEYEMKYEYFNDEHGEKIEILTYTKPEKFRGMQIICSSEEIKHLNPYITKNLTYYIENDRNYNEILFSSFKRNYFMSNKSRMQENTNEIILETDIPSDNFYFKYEKMYIDKETLMPTKMIIENENNEAICIIDYNNFKEYNKQEKYANTNGEINEDKKVETFNNLVSMSIQ